jgi:hypothetical protein
MNSTDSPVYSNFINSIYHKIEELSTLNKIENWFNGPRDYTEGRVLLKTIPDAHLIYLQLSFRETYESKIRLAKALKEILETLKNG